VIDEESRRNTLVAIPATMAISRILDSQTSSRVFEATSPGIKAFDLASAIRSLKEANGPLGVGYGSSITQVYACLTRHIIKG